MKFIARREDRAGERGDEKQERHLHLPANAGAQRTPKQHCQDRVFSQVTEFSDAKLDRVQCRERDLWIDPAQKRHQKPRGVLGREHIGRTKEDYRHPDNCRHPVSDESNHLHVHVKQSLSFAFAHPQSTISASFRNLISDL